MPRCSIMWDLVVVVFVPPAEMRCADHRAGAIDEAHRNL